MRKAKLWVQDAAAALPVRLLGDVAGKRALDLCAAPGGKTMQLAAMGAEVTALDLSEPRMGRVRENLARTGLQGRVDHRRRVGAWTLRPTTRSCSMRPAPQAERSAATPTCRMSRAGPRWSL